VRADSKDKGGQQDNGGIRDTFPLVVFVDELVLLG
jgi:hypothetical protein